MKVLFITHNLKGDDGWSRYSLDLLVALRECGVDVMCLVNEVSLKTEIPQKECLGLPVRYVANPFISWRTSFVVNKYIREFSPDIVHVIVEPYGTMIPFLRNGKAKVVLTVHSTFAFMPILVSGFRRFVLNYTTRWMFAKTDLVISVSDYTTEHLLRNMEGIRALPLVKNKMVVLAGGIDLSTFNLGRTRSDSPTNEILFVGAIKPRKGLKEAIEALALVREDFVFRVVGGFDERNSYYLLLKQKIKEFNIEDKVIFTGKVSETELQKLYSKANLFLMLSTNNGADFEGYGLVYLEANAYGVPCIGPNDSGVSDAIVDGKTGYLVNQYDSLAVAGKIDDVLVRMPIHSEDCVAWARENSKEKKAEKIIGFYNSLLSVKNI